MPERAQAAVTARLGCLVGDTYNLGRALAHGNSDLGGGEVEYTSPSLMRAARALPPLHGLVFNSKKLT